MLKTMPLMSVGTRCVGSWRRASTILAGVCCACLTLYLAATGDAQSVASCTAAGGPSDCLFVVQVRQNAAGDLVPTNVLAGQLTEADEAAGKNIQLVSPPMVFNYSEGPSQGLISDRVIIFGITATFSSDPALDPLLPGVTPIVVQGESLPNLVEAGFTFTSDGDPSSGISDTFQLITPSGPRTATVTEDMELQGFQRTFTEPLTVYDFIEPGTNKVEDRLTVNPFTVSFESDAENGLPILDPLPGMVFLNATETPNVPVTVGSAVALIAVSDGEVPEPSTLALLGIGLAASVLCHRRFR
jgi:PEP-CTERM motif